MPYVYLPYAQEPDQLTLVVRTASEPTNFVANFRKEIWAVDKDAPIPNIKTMEQRLSERLPQRSIMLLLRVFGVALILAASGIYAVMSHSVTQRTMRWGFGGSGG
jgi:hypothetical protein